MFWDQRYSEEGYAYGTEVNDFLKESFGLIKKQGRVLCIGEGEGRNSTFLLKNGFRVEAVDLSVAGKNKAIALSKKEGYELNYHVANLADFNFGFEKWDAVVSIFCHLPKDISESIYKKIVSALAPQGVFILEGYHKAQITKDTGGPKDLQMLYSSDELQDTFQDLDIQKNQELDREVIEGRYHNGLSSVVQFIAKKN